MISPTDLLVTGHSLIQYTQYFCNCIKSNSMGAMCYLGNINMSWTVISWTIISIRIYPLRDLWCWWIPHLTGRRQHINARWYLRMVSTYYIATSMSIANSMRDLSFYQLHGNEQSCKGWILVAGHIRNSSAHFAKLSYCMCQWNIYLNWPGVSCEYWQFTGIILLLIGLAMNSSAEKLV